MVMEAAASPAIYLLGQAPSIITAAPKINHGSRRNIVAVFVIGIITAIAAASLLYFLRRKIFPVFRQPAADGKLKGSRSKIDEKLIKLRRFGLEELEKATNNFSNECLLGTGSFANVYKGTFHQEGLTLAIKMPHFDSYQTAEEFRNEVKLLSKVNHRNLVRLVGFCEQIGRGKTGERILVYEYAPHGCLLDHIIGRGGKSLTWRQRVDIAIGAAKGIDHLHIGIKPCIIHRDIKPSNILIGDGFQAKVSDFGLVRSGPIDDKSYVSSQIKGTPGYLDPSYCSSFHLTPFSDVYSFGIILLQLISARPVLDSTRLKPDCHIIDWAKSSIEKEQIEEILDADLLTEPCNNKMMLKMGQLGLQCVSKAPKDRPTMKQVWQELEEALYSTDNSIRKKSLSIIEQWSHRSMDNSQSFVSLEGVRFQKFHVEMDSSNVSLQSASLKCLDFYSISIDIDDTAN